MAKKATKSFATWLAENDRNIPKQYVPPILKALGKSSDDKELADKIRNIRNGRAKPTPEIEQAFYSLVA